jgi:hypothetical protein
VPNEIPDATENAPAQNAPVENMAAQSAPVGGAADELANAIQSGKLVMDHPGVHVAPPTLPPVWTPEQLTAAVQSLQSSLQALQTQVAALNAHTHTYTVGGGNHQESVSASQVAEWIRSNSSAGYENLGFLFENVALPAVPPQTESTSKPVS